MKSKITLFILSFCFFIIGFILYHFFIDFISIFFKETNNIINTSPNSHFIDRWIFCLGMAIIPFTIITFKTNRNLLISLSLIFVSTITFIATHIFLLNKSMGTLHSLNSNEIKIGLYFTLGIISSYLLKIIVKKLK
ncbi:hypothetical protein HNV03_07475 [Empedobacter stercoris]|uniref:hypothetical protein n=1 Tax=Empedobacter stercoris TaxID=1628248 RepID=UPI00166226FB|nr:hypothetical protein [Empedobacter stercoris]QNT14514.1 hypothetical protein HNV03_07475 [Empedobacter stercoris]